MEEPVAELSETDYGHAAALRQELFEDESRRGGVLEHEPVETLTTMKAEPGKVRGQADAEGASVHTGQASTLGEGAVTRGEAAKVLWPKLCTAVKAGPPLKPGPRLIAPKAKMWAVAKNEGPHGEMNACGAAPAAAGPARMLRPLPRPLPPGSAAALLARAAAAAAAATAEVANRHAQGTESGKGKARAGRWHEAGGHELLPPPPPPPWVHGAADAEGYAGWPDWPPGAAT